MARERRGRYRAVLALWCPVLLCLGVRTAARSRRFGRGADAGCVFAGGQPGRGLLDTGLPRRASDAGFDATTNETAVADLALVNQRGLQFVPRVQAIRLGQTVRFTNQDSETHNVHVVSPHFALNQSMSPGQPFDFTPTHAGVMKLVCDIHHHMRGFVVVSPSPWVSGLRSGWAVPPGRSSRRALCAHRLA